MTALRQTKIGTRVADHITRQLLRPRRSGGIFALTVVRALAGIAEVATALRAISSGVPIEDSLAEATTRLAPRRGLCPVGAVRFRAAQGHSEHRTRPDRQRPDYEYMP
jgi:hypothetical protein